MKNRGPIDFLAALVVEFGGLALLLAALPLLGGGNERSVSQQIDLVHWSKPGGTNPMPRDGADEAESRRNKPAYVADRLGRRGEQLVRSLVGQVERVLEDR